MIRRVAGRPPGLVLEEEFLRAWLRTAGLEERLQLTCERLPQRPERLELWDLWLELQQALLRSCLPEDLEEPLTRAIRELEGGNLRVRVALPADRQAALREGLQGDYPGLRGTAAVLEAVRLAWAAVLSAGTRPQEPLAVKGQVSVRREDSARDTAEAFAPSGPPSEATPASAPDPCLLRLAELHNRLLQPDSPLRLQSLLDLRPWAELPRAAPDEDQERLLLRAAEAAGLLDVPELFRRCRENWSAWVASPQASASPAAPEAVESTGAPPLFGQAAVGKYRQLAGAPGAPGLALGPARLLRAERSTTVLPGEILVCGRLPPSRSAAALSAAGMVTEQGGRLSYAAVLAARAGIPCVCGARGALASIRDGDLLLLDGQLGIAGIRPARGSP
jgi:pyruvate,water dikinase